MLLDANVSKGLGVEVIFSEISINIYIHSPTKSVHTNLNIHSHFSYIATIKAFVH